MNRVTFAFALIAFVGTVTFADEVRREPLILSKSGTPENPVVFDGKGLVIDLAIDITKLDWVREKDLWTSRGPLSDYPPVEDTQRAGLFIDEVPIRIVRDRDAEKRSGDAKAVLYAAPSALQPGQMGWAKDGALYFRWPKGKNVDQSRIFGLPKGLANCVVIAGSYITVRNVIAMHAANDGFNIHGHRIGIRLEHVKALSNGDEGISAHETVQMDVQDAEIAWNGSDAGGVADVNDSITTYTNCELHHNLNAAFYFDGKSHRVTNCIIHHQDKDFVVPNKNVIVEKSGIEWRRD